MFEVLGNEPRKAHWGRKCDPSNILFGGKTCGLKDQF
jgi:hypothetical protein